MASAVFITLPENASDKARSLRGVQATQYRPSAGNAARLNRLESDSRPMRWLMILLLVSLVALLVASAGLAHHIWQEHRKRRRTQLVSGRTEDVDIETEEAQ